MTFTLYIGLILQYYTQKCGRTHILVLPHFYVCILFLYINFADNKCLPQRPYIVRLIIFRRLFVPSTKPLLFSLESAFSTASISFSKPFAKEAISLEWCNKGELCPYDEENIKYLPFDLYALRWNIEVSYYEGKNFWSMENYRVRSSCAIERLVNLLPISYSAMTLLPYSDENFSHYQSASAQETKYAIGEQIQSCIILCSFGRFLETVKNSESVYKMGAVHLKCN